ncbi:GNAT family N-acetyltransferase [Roseisolibacter agri]|uniref:N-acetyltransferase domain-containing protein n=1 Tax=Roseisolibacter agri TaxID=2014610 RepID=A0AA37V9H9_9BACT|nr:GNAT family N-acetyltransferase [Roseisolibacter agri]GLC24448.1 hypothetical protein rosag_09610 [Roseisolibacter agri]
MTPPDRATIELKRLPDVDRGALVALMNHPLVRRHMPLARGAFGAEECARWVAAKERLWAQHGYGPWAFVVDGELAGWGGLQPEGDDVDLGLVLHPRHWGVGRAIVTRILDVAFGAMRLPSVIVLLPPSRVRVRGLHRLGFVADGETTIGDERFVRYRLTAPTVA